MLPSVRGSYTCAKFSQQDIKKMQPYSRTSELTGLKVSGGHPPGKMKEVLSAAPLLSKDVDLPQAFLMQPSHLPGLWNGTRSTLAGKLHSCVLPTSNWDLLHVKHYTLGVG